MPLVEELIVTKETSLETDQEQPAGAATEKLPVPPDAENSCVVAERA